MIRGLEGQHVLVTGAGGGIGRALVRAFQDAGARVSGFDLEAGALDGLGLVHAGAFDVGDGAGCAAAVEALLAGPGTPDVLVNNAGFTRGETIAATDETVWDREVDLNLNGTHRVTRPIVEAMDRAGGGSVVFVASVNAVQHFGNPAYAAAKAGMIAYARALAVEEGARGIRANVVCPGSVRTPAWAHRLARRPDLMREVVRHYPLGRIVEPEEVAAAVLFLASPAASGITGAVLPVDAGLLAGNLRFVREIIES